MVMARQLVFSNMLIFKSPNEYALYAWQAGIGLPDREYYFKEDEDGKKILAAYQAHIEKNVYPCGLKKMAPRMLKCC